MSGLTGRTPTEVFVQFRDHIAQLFNRTITGARLTTPQIVGERSTIYLRDTAGLSAALYSTSYRLYAAQTLQATQVNKNEWRLKTLKYTYRIEQETTKELLTHFRFEYESRTLNKTLYPRYHLHLPKLRSVNGDLDYESLHIPTGWVTIEDVIRFCIVELKVKPNSANWDDLLWASEEKFREWTTKVPPTKP